MMPLVAAANSEVALAADMGGSLALPSLLESPHAYCAAFEVSPLFPE